MTKVTPTTEDRVERINEILDEMVRHIEEKEDLARDVADVLRLFFPGEGHRLFTSPDWRHSPALESEIIGWLVAEEELQPRLRKVLMDGESMIWVHAKPPAGRPLEALGLRHRLPRRRRGNAGVPGRGCRPEPGHGRGPHRGQRRLAAPDRPRVRTPHVERIWRQPNGDGRP